MNQQTTSQQLTQASKTMPVDRLNYSSFTRLLRNPLIFKVQDILGVYDNKRGISAMVGIAGHKALETYYGGNPDVAVPTDKHEARELALDAGMAVLTSTLDDYIEYGKTGSREGMLKNYTQAMQHYFAEEPKYHKILCVEEKLSADMYTKDGDQLPLPATGKPDLVYQNEAGEIEIIDHKFVKSFIDPKTEDWIKIVQSMFMYHLVKPAYGTPVRMVFRQIKIPKNKDGSDQIQDYIIPFDHEQYFVFFYNLYKDVVNYLSNDPIFLPNLSDMFDGEHAGLLYAQGLINADMSDVEVMHKVKDVAFTCKKFVPSRLDRAENKNLPPEEKIKLRLAEFGIPVECIDPVVGPTVTQYRFEVSAGIRMTTVQKHKSDIARAVEAEGDIRVLAPIPGTAYIGVEVENKERGAAKLAKQHLLPNTLSIPIGIDVHGKLTRVALDDMPHLLVAGATGSGKSVMLNTVIHALTEQMTPDAMRLVLIDPKRVELAPYAKLEHVVDSKVVFEPRDAVRALLGLKKTMQERYILLEKAGKRDIGEYNASRRSDKNKLPYVVCIVDEFADLMMQSRAQQKGGASYSSRTKPWLINAILTKSMLIDSAPIDIEQIENCTKIALVEIMEDVDSRDELAKPEADVEYLVARIAQLGRAAGVHMIIATQRPSVDVITGLIKSNFPTRIAFTTSSPTDSQVILGDVGAEKLSGKGDMLFMHPSIKGKLRLQGLMTK